MTRNITTREAAALIGCTQNYVCDLCDRAVLRAERIKDATRPAGYTWSVSRASAVAYAKTAPARGRPRVKASRK